MHSFGKREGTECRLDYADQVAAALRRDPLTAHLAPALDQANAALERSWLDRVAAARLTRRTRAELRIQSDLVGDELGYLLLATQADARLRDSALEKELFPRGLKEARRWTGARRLVKARELLDRLDTSSHVGAGRCGARGGRASPPRSSSSRAT